MNDTLAVLVPKWIEEMTDEERHLLRQMALVICAGFARYDADRSIRLAHGLAVAGRKTDEVGRQHRLEEEHLRLAKRAADWRTQLTRHDPYDDVEHDDPARRGLQKAIAARGRAIGELRNMVDNLEATHPGGPDAVKARGQLEQLLEAEANDRALLQTDDDSLFAGYIDEAA